MKNKREEKSNDWTYSSVIAVALKENIRVGNRCGVCRDNSSWRALSMSIGQTFRLCHDPGRGEEKRYQQGKQSRIKIPQSKDHNELTFAFQVPWFPMGRDIVHSLRRILSIKTKPPISKTTLYFAFSGRRELWID